ncbi:capsular polysaccharide synthesis enzyme Cap8C [Nonlabens ulvanivorans]|nr:CpsB/CapC family capsule biosynthesis tyrosine phosphatase [Nonlabens ulvanivorans]GAK94351.1 capsular polysaccharide synthesis enzyme Cap8C [Nonlabens ulvanivorans]
MLFFSKKSFLVDHLEGLVDIHNHLLPGIDDGSPDLNTTIEMIGLYKEIGYKGCIATPHTMEDYYGNDTNTITSNYKDTVYQLNALKHHPFIVNASSEYMMDSGFEELIESEKVLFLKDRILLTEFSYFQKPEYVNEVVFNMLQKDITPILAHPERYRYIKGVEEFKDLKDRGFLFQLNLLSIEGHYGKDAQKKAMLLLEHNLYDLVGTDAHKPEHLSKIKEIQIKSNILKNIQPVIENSKLNF